MTWQRNKRASPFRGCGTVEARSSKLGKRRKRKRLEQFGSYLRDLRRRAGIATQVKAAEKLGVSTSLVQQCESGDITDPLPELLQKIAEIYGVEYGELFVQLMGEKYNIRPNDLPPSKTATGVVYGNPFSVVKEIKEEIGRIIEGWFFLKKSDSYEDPYAGVIADLIRKRVTLRFWIRDPNAQQAAKEQLTSKLRAAQLIDLQIKEYLRYEKLNRWPEFGRLSEVFFFGNTRSQPSPLLGYWTLPAKRSLTATFIRLEPDLALDRFNMFLNAIEKGEEAE